MQLKAVDIAREPIKLGRDRTVYDVRNVMVKYNIGRVIIVDNHNKVRNNHRERHCSILVSRGSKQAAQ